MFLRDVRRGAAGRSDALHQVNRKIAVIAANCRPQPDGERTVSAAYLTLRGGGAGSSNGWSTADCRLSQTRPAALPEDRSNVCRSG